MPAQRWAVDTDAGRQGTCHGGRHERVRGEIHTTTGATTFYDVEGFLAGTSALTSIVRSEVGSVDGLDLLHLQCHFGLDTLSWAREGARALASRAGLDATFVEADAQRLPADLDA